MKKFIFTKGKKYIAIDTNSGYPYETDYFMNVKVWSSRDDAERYEAMFKDNWQLRELKGLDMSLPI